MNLSDLKAHRRSTWEGAKALLDTAAAQQRDLTAAEQASFTDITADIDVLDARISNAEQAEQRQQNAAGLSAKYGADSSRRELDSGVRAFLNGEVRSLDLSFAGIAEQRAALAVGASGTGGATVPTGFVNRLYEHMIASSGVLRSNPTLFTTTGGEDLKVPTTTAHSTAVLTAEAAALTESDPTFAAVTLKAYKYGTFIKASSEMLADSGVDLTGYLARQAGRAVGNSLGVHLVVGTGTNQPQGIVTGSTLGVTGATAATGAFTADELIDLYFSVIPEYRQGAAWMMNDSTLARVRKLKDADNNYLFTANNAGGPDLLLGRPIVTDPNFASVGVGAKSVVFGDPQAYAVRFAGGIRFERSDDYAFNTDEVVFRCVVRGDGRYVDSTGALKHFIGAAA